jgi:putative ABC transport system permease protein
VAAVGFGVAALLLAAGFVQWMIWATREGTIQTGLGHIHIVKPGYLAEGQADPMAWLLPADSPVPAEIAGLPDVRAVAPRIAFNGLVSRGDATISFTGEGVDPERERLLSPHLIISAGENLSPHDPDGILLGRGLAANLGVQVGDRVVLLAHAASGGINAVECTVRGLFNTVSRAYDDSALRVPLPIAGKLLRTTGAHRWIVVLRETESTDRVLVSLKSHFDGQGLEFIPWHQIADFYTKTAALLSRQIGVVQFIIAAIVVLSISNTLTMAVLERTAEIGTSMALGRRRREILRQFVLEGLSIGAIGAALGLLIGGGLALLITHFGIPMPPPPGMAEGYRGRILLSSELAASAVLIALATALLASIYPAWRASRLDVVDALRHNR